MRGAGPRPLALLALALLLTPGLAFAQGPVPPAGTATAALSGVRTSTAGSGSLTLGRTLSGLESEIKDLRALLQGGGVTKVAVSNLFEVDLLDQGAVDSRIRQLRKELSRTSTEGLPVLSLARLERDRLRLQLLSRSPEERRKLISAEQQRRRLVDQRQAADVALAEAQEREARAEAARLEALEAARRARTAAERTLANERAGFESARSALAAAEVELATRRQEAATSLARELERIRRLELEASDPTLTESAADRLYDTLSRQLEERQAELLAALATISERGRIEHYKPGVELGSSELDALAEARDLLQREIETHLTDESAFREVEHDFLLGHANDIGAQVNRLNRLRLELQARLSSGKRHRLESLTREGIAEIQRELSHLVLLSRWYFRARLARLLSPQVLFEDLLAVGLASWSALKVLLVIALGIHVRRRHRVWLRLVRRQLISRAKSHTTAFWVDRWLAALESVAGALILLTVIIVVFRGLIERGRVPELDLAGDLFLAFGVFRLVLAVLHRSVTSAAEARSIPVSAELSARIYRSLRLIMVYGFAVYLYLTVSESILGRGNLHGIAASFAWIGVLPIGGVLVAHWRSAIVESYLNTHPDGTLASFVKNTRHRRRGFFAALLAFGFVAARGIFVYARETALGFDNTRRALAYFFRRRLEKQAEATGRRATDLKLLPHALVVACGDEELREEALVDHFPELEEVLSDAKAWRAGAPGRTIALVGDTGLGKSTWMRKLIRSLDDQGSVHTFEQRFVGESAVIRSVAEALGLGEPSDRDALVNLLRAAPPRLFILDRCECLFLRSIGGLDGYQASLEAAMRTSDRHFWILAHSEKPWSFLRRAFTGANHFDTVVELEPWSEERVAELIDRRMQLAGVTPVFDDLVVDRVVGTAFTREVIRSGERFRRLLWDYADGNPRIALHFWLRSLESDTPGRARVHLFDGPSPDDLEHLEEQTRFILAALVVHENMTAEEAALALTFSPEQCDTAFRFLQKSEILTQVNGRYRVSTHWIRAVARFLKRKGLIIA